MKNKTLDELIDMPVTKELRREAFACDLLNNMSPHVRELAKILLDQILKDLEEGGEG